MSNSLMSIGLSSLLANQAALTVTGNNVTNQGVEGYHRRQVVFGETQSINQGYGWVGTGTEVLAVTRGMDALVETQYLAQNSLSVGYQTLYDQLALVESRFVPNESYGLSGLLNNFWSAWEDLASDVSTQALRTTLITSTQSLANSIQEAYSGLVSQQQAINTEIRQQVADLNTMLEDLAGLNARVAANPTDNELLDQRDSLVRSISERIDVNVLYKDNGQVTLLTTSGQTLVSGADAYSLSFESAQSFSSLEPDSDFDGSVYFSGSADCEITLKAVTSGAVGGAAEFKVSLDGGATWLTNEDGSLLTYPAQGSDDPIEIMGVEIWFGQEGDPTALPTTDLAEGDMFTIVPKSGLYWYKTSSSKVNVTPLLNENGGNANGRVSGGTLAGLFQARDAYMGEYKRELDTLAETLIWEVNMQHAQGAGLDPMTSALGEYAAESQTEPMSNSGLAFADKLQAGGISLALFDADSGDPLGPTAIDFSTVTPGLATFDPAVHSLDDVAQAINDSFPGQVTAGVVNGQLSLEAASGVAFEVAEDPTGLFAALGVNTFFTGTGASDMAVSDVIAANPDRICASHVNGAGEVNTGDNTTANMIADLATKSVSIASLTNSSSMTINDYLANLVAGIGTDTASAQTNYEYSESLAYSLNVMQEETSGVNLDEEMALLTRYQQAYTAASRLITVSVEMMDTVLNLAP